jgi:hypothetical protein
LAPSHLDYLSHWTCNLLCEPVSCTCMPPCPSPNYSHQLVQSNIDVDEFPSPLEWADPLCPTSTSIFDTDQPSVLEIAVKCVTVASTAATVVAAPADATSGSHTPQVVMDAAVLGPHLSVLWFDMSDTRTDEWLSDWGNAWVAFMSARPVRNRAASVVQPVLQPRAAPVILGPAPLPGTTSFVSEPSGGPLHPMDVSSSRQQWSKAVLVVRSAALSFLPLSSLAVVYSAKDTVLTSGATKGPAPGRSLRLRIAAHAIKVHVTGVHCCSSCLDRFLAETLGYHTICPSRCPPPLFLPGAQTSRRDYDS